MATKSYRRKTCRKSQKRPRGYITTNRGPRRKRCVKRRKSRKLTKKQRRSKIRKSFCRKRGGKVLAEVECDNTSGCRFIGKRQNKEGNMVGGSCRKIPKKERDPTNPFLSFNMRSKRRRCKRGVSKTRRTKTGKRVCKRKTGPKRRKRRKIKSKSKRKRCKRGVKKGTKRCRHKPGRKRTKRV